MSDGGKIPTLIQLASNVARLQAAQHEAARKLIAYDGEVFPTDSCAITLSCLLQDAGIDVPDTYLAIEMGRVLEKRNWSLVQVGNQQAGDVGSTCFSTPHHGTDHTYLVLKTVSDTECVVADNQAEQPHLRGADGRDGKTVTRFFLRAPQ